MKKTLSLILALLMSASCAATIFADEDVAEISAIAEDVPAAEEVVEAETEYDLAIEFLEAKKILQGKGDGLLHAEDAVKRYEMAILGARVATGWVTNDQWMNGTADNTKFNDLEGSGAINALGALSYANQNGIVVGYPDGSFKPENTVTYRDALAIAVRTLGYTGLEYPWGIIEKAVTLGLTDGITGVAYTDTINRGVAAQIIYNALFAKTAGNKTLAMESFGCEYGWETIVVVADDKVVYEVGLNDTKDASGIVAFKLVNDNGTFGAETFNVKADLAFGGFYNALFEIDADAELVDLVKAIEIEPETISNRGNDLETADAIGAFLADYVLVDKYNVKNLSKTTLYDDELILKGEKEETVITGWDAKTDAYYAFDWETGDILFFDGKTYTVAWNYNAEFDYYFKLKVAEDEEDAKSEFVGVDIMDEADVAALKEDIKNLKAEKLTAEGYYVVAKPAFNAYSDLTVWNLNGDDLDDYAIYEKYNFGTYGGINADDDCDVDNSTAHKLNKYVLGGKKYTVEGTCDHHKAGGAHYSKTYTWAEGFEPSEGFTGYVIYGVDNVKNELKIVKEIPAKDVATDDSYVAYGLVRAFNIGAKTVTIGDETFSWDIAGLAGVDAADAKYYSDLFNQFVKYVIVDGKLAHIEVSGNSADYIVVERYLGVDNDGYIVIQGYNTADCKLANFRIGAYDGWKHGSAFFYPVESELADKFVKGNVYKITSTDTTEDAGKVYYVTALATFDADTDEMTTITGTTKTVDFTFEDNYRLEGTTAKKMSADDKYIVIGEKNEYGFKPVYLFKGIVPEEWSVKGDALVKDDHLFIIVNATVKGFDYDSYKVGFVAFLGAPNYDKVSFDSYTGDYYYYGATEYAVKGFDLLGVGDTTVTGYNLDLDANKIYISIDGQIVESKDYEERANLGMKWAGFWAAAQAAYEDEDHGTADYYFFEYNFTKATDVKEISKYLSDKTGADYFFELKNPHDDLLDGLVTKEITLDADGYLTKVGDVKVDWDEVTSVKAYCFYRASDNKVVAYLNEADATKAPVAQGEIKFDNYLPVTSEDGDEAKIVGTATIGLDKDGKPVITDITLAFDGDALTDTNASIIANDFYFGLAGDCTWENWETVITVGEEDGVRYYGSLVGAKYAHPEHNDFTDIVGDAAEVLHDYVKAVKFSELNIPVEEATDISIEFKGHEILDGYTWNFELAAAVTAGKVNVAFGTGSTVSNALTIGAAVAK